MVWRTRRRDRSGAPPFGLGEHSWRHFRVVTDHVLKVAVRCPPSTLSMNATEEAPHARRESSALARRQEEAHKRFAREAAVYPVFTGVNSVIDVGVNPDSIAVILNGSSSCLIRERFLVQYQRGRPLVRPPVIQDLRNVNDRSRLSVMRSTRSWSWLPSKPSRKPPTSRTRLVLRTLR